jgi:hypothetical protein
MTGSTKSTKAPPAQSRAAHREPRAAQKLAPVDPVPQGLCGVRPIYRKEANTSSHPAITHGEDEGLLPTRSGRSDMTHFDVFRHSEDGCRTGNQ